MINNFLHQNALILLDLGPLRPTYPSAKIVLKLLSVPVRIIVLLTFLLAWLQSSTAQDDTGVDSTDRKDSLEVKHDRISPDTLDLPFNDTLRFSAESVPGDTLLNDSIMTDTLAQSAKPKSAFDSEIVYSADDSIRVSLTGEKLYLFGNAQVKYENIELTFNKSFTKVKKTVWEGGKPIFNNKKATK